MKKKIALLGAGLVGKTIAMDLAPHFEVHAFDKDAQALNTLSTLGIQVQSLDFTNVQDLQRHIRTVDLVVGAVPGFLGFQVAKSVLEAGINLVDISFFPEDPFTLDELAKQKNVTAVVDCGVAPGMGNIILGFHNQHMQVQDYSCLVGGLPVNREWPYEYKAVFSPIDVIEEYTRPARYLQNGTLVVKEALSDTELIYFDGIGTLESWNSDGLRSLLHTMSHIPNMIEKTLRYPGCVEYIKVLRETGFFSTSPIEVNGMNIRPIDLTAKLLFPLWKLKPGEEEFTVMRIEIKGLEKELSKKYCYELFDRTEATTETLSMARTTGYTCTAAARLVIDNKFARKGICPPEYLGKDKNHFDFIMQHLKDRGVKYRVTETNTST